MVFGHLEMAELAAFVVNLQGGVLEREALEQECLEVASRLVAVPLAGDDDVR